MLNMSDKSTPCNCLDLLYLNTSAGSYRDPHCPFLTRGNAGSLSQIVTQRFVIGEVVEAGQPQQRTRASSYAEHIVGDPGEAVRGL